MQERARTFNTSNSSKELEAGASDKAEFKKGFDFFNQDLAINTASLTSLREGRTTNMSSEALKQFIVNYCSQQEKPTIKSTNELQKHIQYLMASSKSHNAASCARIYFALSSQCMATASIRVISTNNFSTSISSLKPTKKKKSKIGTGNFDANIKQKPLELLVWEGSQVSR